MSPSLLDIFFIWPSTPRIYFRLGLYSSAEGNIVLEGALPCCVALPTRPLLCMPHTASSNRVVQRVLLAKLSIMRVLG